MSRLRAHLAGRPVVPGADVLGRDRVMDIGIRPLWTGMPRLAGPAYTLNVEGTAALFMLGARLLGGRLRGLGLLREATGSWTT